MSSVQQDLDRRPPRASRDMFWKVLAYGLIVPCGLIAGVLLGLIAALYFGFINFIC